MELGAVAAVEAVIAVSNMSGVLAGWPCQFGFRVWGLFHVCFRRCSCWAAPRTSIIDVLTTPNIIMLFSLFALRPLQVVQYLGQPQVPVL